MNKKTLLFLFLLGQSLLAQTYYMHISFIDGAKKIYAVSDINKITFDSLSASFINKKNIKLLKTFVLLQNYPNPFNPSTTIQYQLPHPGKVKIKIYNTAGQVVKIFWREHQNSGLQKLIWDGTNSNGAKVASGLYIYQAKFENVVISKKMIILK